MSLETDHTSFGFHGTTALGLHYEGGFVLTVESRSTNEKDPKDNLKIKDTWQKFYPICKHTVGIMLGQRNDCLKMRKELMSKCANMESVGDVFKAAVRYVSSFRRQNKKFGTIICGSNAKGSPCRLFCVYVNGDKVVKEVNVQFLTIGSGSTHAKKIADKLMGTTNEANYDYRMSFEMCVEFTVTCVFDATVRDLSSGGSLCVYHVSSGKWTCWEVRDILDCYSTHYGEYEEKSTLFLIVNVARGHNMIANDIIEYFRPYGEILRAHRVCKILVEKSTGFFFHRLVCNTPEDALKILGHVANASSQELVTTRCTAVLNILKAFPYRVTIRKETVEHPRVDVFVNRASTTLLDLLRSSRHYHEPHDECKC